MITVTNGVKSVTITEAMLQAMVFISTDYQVELQQEYLCDTEMSDISDDLKELCDLTGDEL